MTRSSSAGPRTGLAALIISFAACQGGHGGEAVLDAGRSDLIVETRESDLLADAPFHDLPPFEYPGGPCGFGSCCGNGTIDSGEECDDGNHVDGDGCSRLCEIECPWALNCTAPGTRVGCGDFVVTADEVCDDGNTTPLDGCASDCKAIDPGWICPVAGRRCVPVCGDGLVTGPETCDDGNQLDGDGCSATCTAEVPCFDPNGNLVSCPRLCGDGVIEGSEACDDGAANRASTYGGCTTDCRFGLYCGDAVTTEPEVCDLGAGNAVTYTAAPGSGCTPWCQKPHFCGDGYLDLSFGEQCDLGPGNGQPVDVGDAKPCVVCDASCRLAIGCP